MELMVVLVACLIEYLNPYLFMSSCINNLLIDKPMLNHLRFGLIWIMLLTKPEYLKEKAIKSQASRG